MTFRISKGFTEYDIDRYQQQVGKEAISDQLRLKLRDIAYELAQKIVDSSDFSQEIQTRAEEDGTRTIIVTSVFRVRDEALPKKEEK
jgi:hypothetical protein